MKLTWLILTAILLASLFCSVIVYIHYSSAKEVPEEDFFFGVSFGGNTTSQAKMLIDKVKGYTNLFIINSWDISTNETALNEICEYAVDANLNFMVFFDFLSHVIYPWHLTWLDTAKERWEEQFLGVYLYDEPGGRQIESGHWKAQESGYYQNVSDYSGAAEVFVTDISSSRSMQDVKSRNIAAFTSDFALYWFDYLAGYDAVFVELGWNHSRPQQIGLGRGAANVQEKEWGTIITWTYQHPPYLGNGTEILEDMKTAYRAGAKYLIVFNYPTYPPGNPYGILEDEHFEAMQQFWSYMQHHPEEYGKTDAEAAFVLPKDYGWGMRRVEDNVWFPEWGSDDVSPLIWENMNKLTERYGLTLDIIYDDPSFGYEEKYSNIHFWNDQID
ncbi:MAG TPA: hypothetical protein ENN36_05905 [Candidatus Bathyarchaeota archaeon]|nr:hypothetical protein [Candidatus Bathyarchaeota archaeon]